MYLNSGILVLIMITLRSTVIASPDTCGAPQPQGEMMGHFHGGHSYVSYEIDARHMTQDSLVYQDRFCTKNGSGIIAQITSIKQKEDIVIEVFDGHVEIHLMNDGAVEPDCRFILNKKIADGTNYLIKIDVKDKRLNVALSRRYTEIYSLSADMGECLKGNYSSFTFLEKGGHLDDILLTQGNEAYMAPIYREKPFLINDFNGCIGDSMINGVPVAKAGIEKERHDIDPACGQYFSPECTDICATSYDVVTGENCKCSKEREVNEYGVCVTSCNCIKCQNGGTCSVKSGSDNFCTCAPGYEGRYCQSTVDLCRGFYCQNGGSCSVQSSGAFCICLPNFSGVLCEFYIIPEDPCAVVQCQNNGTCQHNDTRKEKFFCSCLPGYEGELCEFQQKSDKPFEEWKIYVIVGAAVGVVIIVAIAFTYTRRKLNQTGGKRTEAQTVTAD